MLSIRYDKMLLYLFRSQFHSFFKAFSGIIINIGQKWFSRFGPYNCNNFTCRGVWGIRRPNMDISMSFWKCSPRTNNPSCLIVHLFWKEWNSVILKNYYGRRLGETDYDLQLSVCNFWRDCVFINRHLRSKDRSSSKMGKWDGAKWDSRIVTKLRFYLINNNIFLPGIAYALDVHSQRLDHWIEILIKIIDSFLYSNISIALQLHNVTSLKLVVIKM